MESRLQPQRNKSHDASKVENPLRCDCGSLLAQRVAQGVEIKCRRCKRHVVVPLDASGTTQIDM
jgi:phage FluMu protein Com